VRVSPRQASVDEAIRVTFPTPYALGDRTRNGRGVRTRFGPATAAGYDSYQVVFEGPGGKRCHGRLRYAAGSIPPPKRRSSSHTEIVEPRRLALGRRSPPRWCPGRFAGHVEFRQPERDPPIAFERLGGFSFEVTAP
jgi:hypothetical protein